ncbi:hypothetical protein H4R19_002910 [Coemansia spiralis]|nr:hypothetical protein H4R19_002910 [Coemansia spiralis]
MALAASSRDTAGPSPAPAASDLEGVDVTADALSQFEAIDRNIFVRVAADASKHEESIPCLCRYNPDTDPRGRACGESSDCINRLVQMECNPLTCPCGSHCLNRRFQKRQYAEVRVVDAGRKGRGVQATEDLDAGAFVMEYMGEVVTAAEFRKRTHVYQTEGIRHHYFMSIGNGKIIDATRKGCVARFINHSCGPNCVLQKWMVGGAIRMGIFADRPIRRGEELTFDYKFERLADAEPQPCFCASPVCKGVIGVAKERASRPAGRPGDDDETDPDLADIDEEIEDGTVTRHQRDDIRRRHAAVDDDDDDDDEYATDEGSGDEAGPSSGLPRSSRRSATKGLTSPEQVLKFVQIMHRSSRQRRIIGILIGKLTDTSDRRLLKSLIALQGMGILRAWLQDYDGDDVMLIQILQCIGHMPIATRNTIDESRLEDVVKPLCDYSDENVSSLARDLVDRWSTLRRVFKIPKKARVESVSATPASGAQSPTAAAATAATSEAPGPARWYQSPAPPPPPPPQQQQQQRMRSESPQGVAGRERQSRGQSPASGARPDRTLGRPPFPSHTPRSHGPTPRSRSPPDYRRSMSGRFGRATTGSDHGWQQQQQQQQQQPRYGSDRHHDDYHQRSRERPARWNGGGAFRPGDPDRPYGSDAGRERRRYNGGSSPRHDHPAPGDGMPRLAPGWRMAHTKDQVAYYYHESTKETRWEAPLADDTARRGHDARPRSAADRQPAPSASGSEQTGAGATLPGTPAPGGDSRANGAATGGKSRQDELIERALRLNVHGPPASGTAGAQQLVTPDTDGEPPANGATAAATAAASGAGTSADDGGSSAGGAATRRSSPDSAGAQQPAAKREKLEKRAVSEVANFVVRAMSKHKDAVGHDEFKHEARKITKILMEKERKAESFDPQRLIDLSQHKKTKIRQFVADYMAKLATRQPPGSADGKP